MAATTAAAAAAAGAAVGIRASHGIRPTVKECAQLLLVYRRIYLQSSFKCQIAYSEAFFLIAAGKETKEEE